MDKINLAEKFSQFSEHYSPKIAGELNGQMVKLVKFKGPFVWHHHDNEDELFYVVKGRFDMEFRDKTIKIIMMTAESAKWIEEKAKAEGVNYFLRKPFSMGTINTILDKLKLGTT